MGYEIYGLKDNPFPRGGAILKPESQDPRENGSIFSVNARAEEIKEFEEKFIGTKTSFDDRIRCGFLWADGDRTTGRGMGKTALAVYMKHKINDGYGKNYFDGGKKFFCSYISFNQQMVAKIGLFFQEALHSFIKDRIFEEISRATNVDTLVRNGVDARFAQEVANNSVRRYLEEKVLGHPLHIRDTKMDWRVDHILKDLFLNQTTRCLKTAGFAGGILLVDDIENLTDRSTPRQIETFIKDFGLSFFRTGNEASNSNFYTIILTTHQQSARKISQAWTVAGLSASFPLDDRGYASLLTRKPELEQAIDMVIQYIRTYRDPTFNSPSDYYPFTEDAIKTVIKECDFHPRRFLSRFNRIMVEAVSRGITEITAEFVKTVPEVEESEDLPGIEEL
ncbi:MAG: hypothetical protein NC926_08865 [Candidatus Omnitrophica bacterium]|nr:hypothetical protein [Candidatus Omnitrophota bacterium]